MTEQDDFEHVKTVLNGFAAAFKDTMPPDRLLFYWDTLKELQRHEFDYCTAQIAKTHEYNRMPLPAVWFRKRAEAWK